MFPTALPHRSLPDVCESSAGRGRGRPPPTADSQFVGVNNNNNNTSPRLLSQPLGPVTCDLRLRGRSSRTNTGCRTLLGRATGRVGKLKMREGKVGSPTFEVSDG